MKKNLNIAVISKYYLPTIGGIEIHLSRVYGHMVSMGHEVTIHCLNNTYSKHNHLASKEILDGIKIVRYQKTWLNYFPKIDWQKIDVLALHNFDIFPHSLIMLRVLVHKLFGLKKYQVVLTPHGGFSPSWSTFSVLSRAVKYIYSYTIGVLLIRLTVDKIRAISVWEEKEFLSHLLSGKDIVVIPNGLEDEVFLDMEKLASEKIKNEVKKFGDYILENARIYPIKNIDVIIKALPQVKNMNLIIVGSIQDQEYYQYLQNLVKSKGLESRVIFYGNIWGVDKYYLVKHSKVFVHMARWESFGNVILEALASGKICVVANNTAQKYLVNDQKNGFLIPDGDVEALVNCLKYIVDPKNQKYIKKIEKHNFATYRDHTWKNVAEQFVQFLHSSK